MSALALQQQALLGALLTGPRGALATRATAGLASHLRAPWARGLAAYQANGHDSAERSLRAAYPVVQALVGDESFALIARDLWHHQPPVRGDLACWGDGLPGFLAASPQLADVPYLADVARVEWALHRAAGAADAAADPASFEALTRLDPDTLTLRLAPGSTLIESPWPVASLVTAHLLDDPPLAQVAERLRAGTGECARVWRQGYRPRVAPCSGAEAGLLKALLEGRSLLAGLNAALAVEKVFDFGTWLAAAVTDGQVLGAAPRAELPGRSADGPETTGHP